ncbi:UNVERIFIED_CONTAM: LINE-1 reverse transcriptase [Sesamum radiatum]|uniref:LINE-1 reverse transcriptase n=1 Tax=Sesamum radiatum TaxID=300843 RepID=A0AAW2K8U3_SESRA
MLVNDAWMVAWPDCFYQSLTPRTSDHSPLVLCESLASSSPRIFRFDHFLANSPEFIVSVQNVWRQWIVGTPMYSVTHKLKALKPIFTAQRRKKGDLAMNQPSLNNVRYNREPNYSGSKAGDQCTRVFFRKIARRSAAKRIFQITTVVRGATLLLTYNFYDHGRHIIIEGEAASLINPVAREELKSAFFDIEEDRAPGPDGYSTGFYKAAWPIIGDELITAVTDFFENGRLLKQMNATLLTLIPKAQTPTTIADFRQISYCSVLYKTITKILVQRLQPLLDRLINPTQNAFIPGRSISDNILLAQELFAGYNQQRMPLRCTMQVDLRKAYDTVEWDILLATIKLFGFLSLSSKGEECGTTCSFSLCLNGGIHGFFAGARGLRQGDPMSPYLFVLVMELSFANDILLFYGADEESVGLFKRSLLGYPGCVLILTKVIPSSPNCQPLFQKIEKRIRAWDGIPLTFAVRVQLIKSVIMAFHVCWGLAFILPKGVIRHIKKMMRTFLWKGTTEAGYAKVAWKDVCLPLEEGHKGYAMFRRLIMP